MHGMGASRGRLARSELMCRTARTQITQPFELYLTIAPNLPKSAAVGAANAVARWVVQEESRLFLREAPVF